MLTLTVSLLTIITSAILNSIAQPRLSVIESVGLSVGLFMLYGMIALHFMKAGNNNEE